MKKIGFLVMMFISVAAMNKTIYSAEQIIEDKAQAIESFTIYEIDDSFLK